jgi:hypothetical protein
MNKLEDALKVIQNFLEARGVPYLIFLMVKKGKLSKDDAKGRIKK